MAHAHHHRAHMRPGAPPEETDGEYAMRVLLERQHAREALAAEVADAVARVAAVEADVRAAEAKRAPRAAGTTKRRRRGAGGTT